MNRLDIYDYHLDPCVQSRFEGIWTGCWGFPCGSSGKESVCQCRRLKKRAFDPWVRKIPGGGHGNPFQYSCLKNPMDRGAWQSIQSMGSQRGGHN